MLNITKARHDLLARFTALKHDPRTGGELTVRTNPQPSRAVRMPDPRLQQETIHALCKTIHAVQAQNRVLNDRLAALEQGKFATTGQPATLTVTVLGGRAPVPTVAQPREQAKQTDTGSYGNVQHGGRCPLVFVDYPGDY